jgi:uncharacterized protein (DUF3084 family)
MVWPMENDLIDEDGFGELGIPSPLEMFRQQAHLLIGEVDDLQRELRQSKANLSKVITMHADATKERDRLKLELDRVRWELSDRLLADSREATAKLNVYAGAHNFGKGD